MLGLNGRYSFIFLFHNFYQCIIDVQCCVSFFCTAKWINYANTYIYPFLDSIPIYIIIEYFIQFPVLYSSFMVIYFIYRGVYMSVPVFAVFPCCPPPLVTISLFSMFVTLFLFCKQTHLYNFFLFRFQICAVLNCSVMSDSLRPMDCSPPGSSVHWDSPAKNTGVGYLVLFQGIFPTPAIKPRSLAIAGSFFTI